MANRLLLKRTATPGKVPALADLQLGELGINTYDGKLYLRKDNGSPSIIEIGGGSGGVSDHGLLTGLSDNDHPQYGLLTANNNWTGTNYHLNTGFHQYPVQYPSGVPVTNLGAPSITEMALFGVEYTNKTRFFPTSLITCEYTTDGTNWVTDPNATDIQKRRLVAGAGGNNPAGLNISTSWQRYRITFANNYYVFVGALYAYLSTSGNTLKVKMWRQQASDNVWVKFADSETAFSNWPGHVYLPFENTQWSTTAGQHKAIRVEFIPVWSSANPISLYNVELWGGYPNGRREIYSWDEDQITYFPAEVDAPAFRSTGATSALWFDNRSGGGSNAWYASDLNAVRLNANGADIAYFSPSGYLQVQGAQGSATFGPQNAGYCHMHTDRPAFYFNKDITIATSTNPSLMLSGQNPLLKLYDPTGAVNEKYWGIYHLYGGFNLMTFTDALGGGQTAISVIRAATTVTTITLSANAQARLICDSTGVAFNGATPAARPDYTITGSPNDRTINAAGTSETVATLSNCLATLINDLVLMGLLQ